MVGRLLARGLAWGARTAGKGAVDTTAAYGGFAAGAGLGVIGMASGIGWMGYKAMRGYGPALAGPRNQLNRGIQSRMIGGVLGAGTVAGLYTRDPGYRADFSPGGNLEIRQPMEATGDLALALNRNGRGVPARTRYGYMTTTSIPAAGR